MRIGKARAHTNIALIKYWGKANNQLKLPQNSSLSMTLDAFYTDTNFQLLEQSTTTESSFSLNNVVQEPASSRRVFDYIETLQDRYRLPHDKFKIQTTNHVPTSAGLASSSSAFAALAQAFVAAYQLDVDKQELSRLARLGSGSATRSIYGGFVEWQKGTDDQDSIAMPIDEQPTIDLCLLAVEINFASKGISSTAGMQQVVNTSPYYGVWRTEAERGVIQMKQAIKANDFTAIGTLAERSALAMHALNFTANPPFTYLEPETIHAIKLVEQLRIQGIECYFTIDAGPNVKILCQLRNVKEITERFKEELGNVNIIKASFGPGVINLD
ncbi:mevalonate pyrophosphate decarboxylase [Amylolactobacillus amylotrophicus DSM 20534]|uniref:Diphosphomevalonate decarboxylase n=3 Tax=Amylolactobacillus TaxID=2767876 RepID=A0A1L6XE09_9LACO|nr:MULTISPECIES: diphosphomevalonate decarboxylase [Amylolactobacillus]APT19221.1 diphosphomevalonate decarboxylase [Amylolactobacillus amylophilus DSM 20533 = JCM 1125]KRK38502.1 mevalonate pyrophosphate decarboxylase [Amylolactobacillus amylotrophicus DSM 20534]KRM42855.1 mevalonate pyrophosphate decarboxylase [Amylolactobacillus amylophilus DSM 20533 = JCM 1125]GED79719.1 diphosphomevalonate decarboxylase [Amylolactobacillus amylophilus]